MASSLPVDERSSLLQRSAEGVADNSSRNGFAAMDTGPDRKEGDDGGGGGGRDTGALARSSTLFPLRGQSRERYFVRRFGTGGGGLTPLGSDDGGVSGGGGGHGSSAHRRQRIARMAARLGLSAKARDKVDAQLEAAAQPGTAVGSGAWPVDGESDGRVDDHVRSVAGAGRDEMVEDVDERVAALLSSLAAEEESTAHLLVLSTAAVVAHVATAVVVYHVLEGWSWTDCVYFTVVSLLTVGFGDLVPTHNSTKIFTCCFAFVSIALITAALNFVIGFIVDRQEEMVLGSLFDREAAAAESETNDHPPNPFPSVASDVENPVDNDEAAAPALADHVTAGERHELIVATTLYLLVLVCGAVVFSLLQGLSVVDAVYLVCMSATTVGFGDLDPSTPTSRLFATVWLIFSTLGLAKVLADYTDTRLRAKQRRASARLLSANLTESDFQLLDQDGDGTVSNLEYMRMMLLKTGKVRQEDLDEIQRSFARLDRNGSGNIDRHEMLHASNS